VVLQDVVDPLEVLHAETLEDLLPEWDHPVEDHHHPEDVATTHPLLCVDLMECLPQDNRVLRL